MPLIIVESPKKIPKIRKCLDNSYQFEASVGHIMDLAKKDMGIKLPELEPVYEVYGDKKEVVKRLKAAAKEHDKIYIATDADREGEAIAYNILSILPKRGKDIQRVIFKEINKREIKKGLDKPIGFREDFFKSQQARRMIDRLVGFKVSPLMWTKGLKNTSAGRVQSAALKFIVDREKEIRAFKKEEYWTIKAQTDLNFIANFFSLNGKKFVPKNEKEAKGISGDIKGDLTVTKFEKKTRTRKPYPPFETSTMQQDAGSKFGWTGKKVMDVAQSLFSQGLITYHRTDSVRCDPDQVVSIREKIEDKFGKKFLSAKPIVYGSGKDSQDAHEAIRPTFEMVPMELPRDEKRLLDLIRARFMASQMAEAKFAQASMELEYQGKGSYGFKASGSVMQFEGFLKVYGSAQDDVSIPSLDKGQSVSVNKVIPEQHFTKPPARFTDPSLTKKVKKEGIGRPSTYATIAEHLVKRGYITRKKNTLFATEIGIMVCDYLEKFFESLTNVSFTSDMESRLDKIAGGDLEMKKTLQEFLKILESDIDSAKRGSPNVVFMTDKDCSSCSDGSKMIKKVGRNGVFLGCQNYPECGHVLNFDEDGNMIEDEVETGQACPVCSNKVKKVKGKWGEFYGCSSYPVCNWTGKLDSEGNLVTNKKAEVTDIDCPECKEGNLVKRKRKKDGGEFYGCNRYPKCKYGANIGDDGQPVKAKKSTKKKAKPTGKTCPKCKKHELVERDGQWGKFVACSGYPKCKHIVKEK
jgi:DNA topoisomerase-1